MELLDPRAIEQKSMEIIEAQLRDMGMDITSEIMPVVKRVIHTTADFDYAETLFFSDGVMEAGIRAMRGNQIITDTNMALAGINKQTLAKAGSRADCFMADEAVAREAKERGITRAIVSMERAAALYPNGVFVIGNAPTALLALADLMESGLRPSLLVGVPVGFVNVEESKEKVIAVASQYDIPVIVARGQKGGSNVAAAICNALLYLGCPREE